MVAKQDGGPAFPGNWNEHGEDGFYGMTLRDYFAAQVLIGFQVFVRGGWSGAMPEDMTDNVAANCYAIADAMLAQRQK